MNKEDAARKIIEDVLSMKEFQEPASADLSWLESIRKFFSGIIRNIFEFFIDILQKLFSSIKINPNFLRGGVSGTITIVRIVVVCFILVLIFFVILIIIRLLIRLKIDRKIKAEDDDEIASFIEKTDEPIALSRKYEEEGNYRLAFRYLYIALLINLNKREIIHIEKAKTNRQYIREIRENKLEIIDGFISFTEAFAIYWYGKRAIAKDQLVDWYLSYNSLCGGGTENE